MKKIDETMKVIECLDLDDDIAQVFIKNDLNCVGCPGATNETIAEACEGHGVNVQKLLVDLNNHLDKK